MSNRTGTPGQALAAAGGFGLAASLWLPWYTVHIPQAALDSVNQMAQQFGALGPLVRSGTQLISALGPFHFTAWQAFTTIPAVLLVTAIIGGGLALLALTDRAGNTSQLTTLAGAVGTLLVGYRLAVPPWQNSFVHPAWGIYLGLVSALMMLAGGFLAGKARGVEAPMVASAGGYPAGRPAESWEPATEVWATGATATAFTASPDPSSGTHSVAPPTP